MITLENKGLLVELCEPGEYYKGTRFDHAGVFRRIVKEGYAYADEWFDHSDPFRHDRVCGLSEEFVTVEFAPDRLSCKPGELFCKPGVGLLRRPDDAPYDWFRLYENVEPGWWEICTKGLLSRSAVYTHHLPGWYDYSKRISLPDGESIVIEHTMRWQAPKPLEGFFYNHNFFTFGGVAVGPSRKIAFPWKPSGDWRSRYDNVAFTKDGIEFSAPVSPGSSVYCGNIHNASGLTECRFSISDASSAVDAPAVDACALRRVEVCGDRPLHHIVFWSNDRVACIEPYLPLRILPGETLRWSFRYRFPGQLTD